MNKISSLWMGGGIIHLLIFWLFTACDFTPRIHKDILNAQQSLSQQNFVEASKRYQKILEKSPDEKIKVKIHYQLGEIQSLHLGKYWQAIKHFQKVQESTQEPLWQVKSEERIAQISFEFLKNYRLSLKSYKRLASFTPRLKNYDKYEYRIAKSYMGLKKFEMARRAFVEIQKNKNQDHYVDSFYQLGLVHFELKNWQEAINKWKLYIQREKKPDSVVQAKFLMANAFETMEELKKAYNLYYSILGEYPNTQVVQNRLNAIYKRRVARKR